MLNLLFNLLSSLSLQEQAVVNLRQDNTGPALSR
jgi:hypothetical protein